MIRVMIADDHAVLREGIKRVLAGEEDLCVVAESADGQSLLAALEANTVDVVLLDLAMPGMSGLEVLERIRRDKPDLPVLVLSMYPAAQYAVRAISAGASGYINKGRPPAELVTAIRTVASGRHYIDPEVAESLAAHLDKGTGGAPHERLSNRENEVLRLIAHGRSVSDIAKELSLSVKTVSTYRVRILEKLCLRHNAEIMRYAFEHGLV